MRRLHEDDEIRFEKIRRAHPVGRFRGRFKRDRLPNCNGKHSYQKEAAVQVRESLLASGSASFLRIYRCPDCFYWHLTSKPLWRKSA